MTETIDQLIQTRFDAIASPLHDANWNDVLARAGRVDQRRRAPARIALAAAVVVVAATITAVALGWPGTVIDFFKAPAAPESVKAFFAGHNSPFPSGVNPETRLGQPRQIMTATFDANHLPPTHPTVHTLYVAPRTGGGFCFVWTTYGGSCTDPEDPAKARTDPAARPTGLTWLEDDYVGVVDGWVRGDAKSVVAHFADGATAAIPVTWVSAPISAGFFAYAVPPAHLARADALTAIVALDADGKVVSRQPFELKNPLDEDVTQTLPDGTKVSLPRDAQAAQAREIVSSRANGSHIYLWVMPRIGGGGCYLFGTGAGGGFGCTPTHWVAREPVVDGGVYGGNLYFAQVKPEIVAVELRLRNGGTERLTPLNGFVGHEVEGDAQPVAVAGLDRSGNAIFTQQLQKGPRGG